MPIQPTNPITIPSKTADTLWVGFIYVNAPNPQSPVTASVRLIPMNSTTGEMFSDYAKTLEIDDLFAIAADNATLASAIQGLFGAIQQLAQAQGLF